MAKIGRNQPCPCGSGKKYKKCCLGRSQVSSSSTSPTMPRLHPPNHDSLGLANGAIAAIPPYVRLKMAEQSDYVADLLRRNPAEADRLWLPGRAAALATDDLLRRLRGFGIETSPEAFCALAAKQTSAWALSDTWRAQARLRLSKQDDHFVGLAACELWKRYCPHRPSVEMIDDWMQEGYDFSNDHHYVKTCERWAQVWAVLRPQLQPHMRTIDSTDSVFNGTQSLMNWLQDYALELQNAALVDTRHAEAGMRLCHDVLAQFPDDDEIFVTAFRGDLGEFYFLAGRPEEGERILSELIADHPDSSIGYARLSDLLGHGVRPNDPPIDLQRAIDLLETALAKPVADAEDFDLAARLSDLRSQHNGTVESTSVAENP